MTAYAVAHLRSVEMGPPIVEYLERIDATLRAILRAGAYELIRRPDVPIEVAIDEYVEIAKSFFEGPEPGFVNGALDGIARDARG